MEAWIDKNTYISAYEKLIFKLDFQPNNLNDIRQFFQYICKRVITNFSLNVKAVSCKLMHTL